MFWKKDTVSFYCVIISLRTKLSTDMKVEDEGTYTCMIVNQYGTLQLQASLSLSGLCEYTLRYERDDHVVLDICCNFVQYSLMLVMVLAWNR